MKSRDHRARVTQILIQKALTKLLREKPIHRISVKELCEEAGINRGTFYAHYTDIYDLLKQMEDDLVADLQKAMEPLMREDAQEPTLVGITSVIFRCLKENADICAVTLGPYGDREFVGRLLDSARESCLAVYARNFDATPWQLECYYAFASAGCIGLLEKWVAEGMEGSAEELADIAGGIMAQGIGFLRHPEGAQ